MTRQRVLQAAADLGYRPNLAAQTLAAGRSGFVMLVIADVRLGELTIAMSSFLTSELARHGLTLVVHFDAPGSRPLLDVVADLRPRAVISMFEPTIELVTDLKDVGVTSYSVFSRTGTLGALHLLTGEMQVAHLVSQGHKVIGFAEPAEPGYEGLSSQRFLGVADACARRGLPKPCAVRFDIQATVASEGVQQLMDAGATAVCAYNDDVALVVLAGIRGAGLECPADLAVIGVDNIVAGYSSEPSLSTVELRPEEVARLEVAAVLERLGFVDDENGEAEVAAALGLIVRAST